MLRLLLQATLRDGSVKTIPARFECDLLEQLIRDSKVNTVACDSIGTDRSTIVCDSALKPTPTSDEPLMPFGRYKGQPMQDVPVNYLHWLWHNDGGVKDERVRRWIVENWNDLVLEDLNLLWRATPSHLTDAPYDP